MTDMSTRADVPDNPEATGTVAPLALAPAFDAMAQRVLTRGHTTTWLNHWSFLYADFRALARMNTVGFDGTLLQLRLRLGGHEVARTSADLVLPHVFARLEDGARCCYQCYWQSATSFPPSRDYRKWENGGILANHPRSLGQGQDSYFAGT